MPQKEEPLRDYIQFIRKYTFVICLSTLLVLGTALVISLRIPKTYSASTLLRFIQSNNTSPISSTNLFQTVLSGGVDRREMTTISERFSTESMLNAAVENLEDKEHAGIKHLPSVGLLKRKLKAQLRPESDYIELSIELTEAEGGERNAALLVNQLARDMQTLRSENEKTRVARHQKFLEQKRVEVDQEIQKLTDEILKFVKENESPETWYPRLTSLLQQNLNLQERLALAEQTLDTAKRRLTHLNSYQKTLPKQTQISETQSHNPQWLSQREKLLELETQRIGDEKKAGKSSHEISGLNAQIEFIQQAANETPKLTSVATYGTSAHYTYIQNQLIELPPTIESSENETKRLNQELQKTRNQLETLLDQIPGNQHTITQLRAKIELAGSLKEEIEKRYLESEILSADSNMLPTQKGGIAIDDTAVPRKVAVKPQFRLIVMLSGIIGLCFGVTLALLIEFVKPSHNNPSS